MNDSTTNHEKIEVATLGGGCFWCTEAVFQRIRGVLKVEPGYAGGTVANPTYDQVCTGTTGHAEVVQVTFDSDEVAFSKILEVFFATHDPTTVNRQGADVGTQYRSVIFYHSVNQKKAAEKIIRELNNAKAYQSRIVTHVLPFVVFYKAEDYHKEYFKRHPEQPYCRLVIAPKIAKLNGHHSSQV